MPRILAHDALQMIHYGDDRNALVFAGSQAASERAEATLRSAGLRIGGVANFDGAIERLDRQAAVDVVFVEAEEPGPHLERLLHRLRGDAATGRHGTIISTPPPLIDAVAALAWHVNIEQLCDASEAERIAAVERALDRPPARLHDVRRDGDNRLQQLSEEVGRIASVLASLSEEVNVESGDGRDSAGEGISAAGIRAIIRARRLRDRYFGGGDLFADPAWDMLLDLFAARLDDQQVAVSSLCIAAAVPSTTALRWIKALSDNGLFERRADPEDGRRVYIALADQAAAGMDAYMRAARRITHLIV